MIEIRLVSFKPGLWSGVAQTEAQMQDLLKQGFLILRCDIAADTLVYVFTRTVTPT